MSKTFKEMYEQMQASKKETVEFLREWKMVQEAVDSKFFSDIKSSQREALLKSPGFAIDVALDKVDANNKQAIDSVIENIQDEKYDVAYVLKQKGLHDSEIRQFFVRTAEKYKLCDVANTPYENIIIYVTDYMLKHRDVFDRELKEFEQPT